MIYFDFDSHRSSVSLPEFLKERMENNGITEKALSDALGIDRRSLNRFLTENADLKFSQAVSLMYFLGMDGDAFVGAFEREMDDKNSEAIRRAKAIAFILDRFEVQTLKKIGVLKKRSTLDTYEEQLNYFWGFKGSIFEYDTCIRHPSLFSKSRLPIEERKARRMLDFWLKCAILSFERINNPYEYDRDTLIEFLKHIHEYTEDVRFGYERVVMVLYRLGVTVLTQPYIEKTGAFGVTMVLDGKPCIVITDLKKNYHKLWLSLIHELYHVINDFDLLSSTTIHVTSEAEPDLLYNERKADEFALHVLIPQDIVQKLGPIVCFESKMKTLSNQLQVDMSILYGVYLESLPKEKQVDGYRFYSSYLRKTTEVSQDIFFNPVEKGSLEAAIREIKDKLSSIKVA